MQIRQWREQLRGGRSLFDLPLRVTFYARVSTDKVEQQGSLENQIQYYTDLIEKNPNWTYVPGYVDEGLSGTSTRKRESFLRMIADARRGAFDLIITKEISRFSRNTLDSIQYTQKLLEYHVGVLFQNDNLNTLDSDSEFRLVVMAGVAQDEVRKLSERLKFGFRQSIKNGRVLGNDRLWGYDKKDCRLTVHPEQAEVVRLIFTLYATGQYGIRALSRELTSRGYTSALGNPFNQRTIQHILTNPKYKGWYCGHKTQSLDYRTKKTAALPPSQWVMYPDPGIPALVSEALWDKANALYRTRSARAREKTVSYHTRYPYSGKLLCGKHGASFHRQCFKTKRGETEYWRCRLYRQRGKEGCALPAVRTREVDAILTAFFQRMVTEPDRLVRLVLDALSQTAPPAGLPAHLGRVEAQLRQIEERKDQLLELSAAGAITLQEFRSRNDRFNRQLSDLEERLLELRQPPDGHAESDPALLEQALREELSAANGVSSEVLSALLDHIVVREESTDRQLDLELYFCQGQTARVQFDRESFALWESSS